MGIQPSLHALCPLSQHLAKSLQKKRGKYCEYSFLAALPPTKSLIDIRAAAFLHHWRVLGFGLCIPRFLERLALPAYSCNALHPCLLNAVLLFGCHYSLPEYRIYEPYLLIKVREQMSESLAVVDRLSDFLVAGGLLARWYACKGRELEAHHEAIGKPDVISRRIKHLVLIV